MYPPLERVIKAITGLTGKWISIVARAICGAIFSENTKYISGGGRVLRLQS